MTGPTYNQKLLKELEELKAKKNQLDANIKLYENKLGEQKRKDKQRRIFLLGEMLMKLIDNGDEFDLTKNNIKNQLDKFLIRNVDRALFDLPAQDADKKIKSTKTETVIA
jgi:hypothetical protein